MNAIFSKIITTSIFIFYDLLGINNIFVKEFIAYWNFVDFIRLKFQSKYFNLFIANKV